jgi:hypothetical protein
LANLSGLFAADEIRMSAVRQFQCAARGRDGEGGGWFALVDVFATSHRHAIDCAALIRSKLMSIDIGRNSVLAYAAISG